MPQKINKATGAMFDVRPVDKSGRVDVLKIEQLSLKIDLAKKQDINNEPPNEQVPEDKSNLLANNEHIDTDKPMDEHHEILREIEKPLVPDYHEDDKNKEVEDSDVIEKEVPEPLSGQYVQEDVYFPSTETDNVDYQLSSLQWQERLEPRQPVFKLYKKKLSAIVAPILLIAQKLRSKRVVVLLLVFGAIIFGTSTFVARGRVIEQGNIAVEHLESARVNLSHMDFNAASEDFTSAYEEFSSASNTVNVFGDGLTALIGNLPGGGAVKSVRSIIEAGKLISQAGQAMTRAVDAISKTGWVLNPQGNSALLAREVLLPLRDALSLTSKNMEKAYALLSDVDDDFIPQERRDSFEELIAQLPEFQALAEYGIEYTNFFELLVSGGSSKKYLLLFQNFSELRPTGGFPGTYGVMTLSGGRVVDFFADDIYNLDGQLKELIIPPKQLQHITPNWGMRDAAWFVDFPVSARKVSSFFEKEAGYSVDGVIAINPRIMSDILEIVGPISMPEFGITLTGDNFLPLVQSEVEYGDNREQPKKIISDLAPVILQKLYSAEKDKWLDVFNALMVGMERKDVLMYFSDKEMQDFVVAKDFGGEVNQTNSDFLMVTFSNIKGSKTDAVTESIIKFDTELSSGMVKHTLGITRRHNGDSATYGFYRRQNSSFVRVLVPDGSKLIKISGNSSPYFKPLLNYPKTDFKHDKDLGQLEMSAHTDASTGVTVFRESGKTEFGFWMLVDPGEIKTVEIEYEVPRVNGPDEYELYIQKQPGLTLKSFEFTISGVVEHPITDSSISLRQFGNSYVYNGNLEKDLDIRIEF